MEHASGRVEREILVGVMRGGSQPSEAVHRIDSMWSVRKHFQLRKYFFFSFFRGALGGELPVKFLPKTRFSGRISAFGVTVAS